MGKKSKMSRRPPRQKKIRLAPLPAKVKTGTLIIIGGREDKEGNRAILTEVAMRSRNHRLVVATVASELPNELWHDYKRVFHELGVSDLKHLHLEKPDSAREMNHLDLFKGAETVFFTGGDQLKITTRIGGTPIADRICEIYRKGGTIVGTSAGASVLGETMLVGSETHESHKIGNWMMAPGLGLIPNMIIDQHFAQRGRIGRLLGAIALNPGVLGIGVDENTAVVIEDSKMRVVGSNAVYVVDGHAVTYTNVTEAAAERTMSMHDVRLHILADGDEFDLVKRHPTPAGAVVKDGLSRNEKKLTARADR